MEEKLLYTIGGCINSNDAELMSDMIRQFNPDSNKNTTEKLSNGYNIMVVQGDEWKECISGACLHRDTSKDIKTYLEETVGVFYPSDIHLFTNETQTGFVIASEGVLTEIESLLVSTDDSNAVLEVIRRVLGSFYNGVLLCGEGGTDVSFKGYVFAHHQLFKVAQSLKGKKQSRNKEDESATTKEQIDTNTADQEISSMLQNSTTDEYDYDYETDERMDNTEEVTMIQFRKLKRCNLACNVCYILKRQNCTLDNLLVNINNELISMGFRGDITLEELKTSVEDLINKKLLERNGDVISIVE